MMLSNIFSLISGGIWGWFIATTMIIPATYPLLLSIIVLLGGAGFIGFLWGRIGEEFNF